MEAFTAQQTARLTGCTAHQLRYWDRVGLVKPSIQASGARPGRRRLYAFRDLVTLRVVKSLLDNGMSVQRVRRAWDYLRRTADMDRYLAEVDLITDGQSISRVASDEDELLDALREGQLAFFVAINEITQKVEEDVTRFELDRERFTQMLQRIGDEVYAEARSLQDLELLRWDASLPPPEMAPTTYLSSARALLVRRPITALALYACDQLGRRDVDVAIEALATALGRRRAAWCVHELKRYGLLTEEFRITDAGRAALRAFESAGFTAPRAGFVEGAVTETLDRRRRVSARSGGLAG